MQVMSQPCPLHPTPQLLGEFASLCGPLAGPLATLRQELLPALYSSWCAAAGGLAYEQVPWFEVAARLQRDKEALQELQEGWRRALAQRQVGRLAGWLAGACGTVPAMQGMH
jgi:hypothetical protein